MGLDISIKGMEYEDEYHCGYITFNNYRKKVARSFSNELGDLYELLFMHSITPMTKDQLDRLNELANQDEGIACFLSHSDCDGSFNIKECRMIHKSLSKLEVNMQGHNYGTMNYYDMHQQFIKMFERCYKNRVKMIFS